LTLFMLLFPGHAAASLPNCNLFFYYTRRPPGGQGEFWQKLTSKGISPSQRRPGGKNGQKQAGGFCSKTPLKFLARCRIIMIGRSCIFNIYINIMVSQKVYTGS